MPAMPAFAASVDINASGELTVLSTQEKDLPSLTNKSDKPITVKIQAEGLWNFGPGKEFGKQVDANGNPRFPGAPNDMQFPSFNAATLVALKNNKPVASGKEQTIKLLPGETVFFTNNDLPTRYGDNTGSQKIKFSISPVIIPCPPVVTLPVVTPPVITPPVITPSTGGKLVVYANEEKNLPSLTNTFDKPVKVKIQADGQWNFGKAEIPSVMVDADGNNTSAKFAVIFPSIKPAALVALKNNKPVANGKKQEIELLPGETLSFLINDQPGIYGDNIGSQTINYTFKF